MTIYTGAGDKGTTTTPNKKKISKADPTIEIYGTLDELNVDLGTALCFVQTPKSKKLIPKLQKQIFEISAHVSDPKPVIGEVDTKKLENEIGVMEEKLHVVPHSVIPGGTKGSCFLHQARVRAREVERRLSAVNASGAYLKYFNRLSDLLFVLARWENHEEGLEEEVWNEWAD